MKRVDLRQSLISNTRVDQFHDEMCGDSGLSTEVVTASAGATTWTKSTMLLSFDGDAANDELYRVWSVPSVAAQGVFETEARIKIDSVGITSTAFIFGVMLASNAAAGALVDTTLVPKAGAFCGVYIPPVGRLTLVGQGASETRQTKTLDFSPTANSYFTVNLRLEAGPSTMSLYVAVDREGLSNPQQLRGYQDPPQVQVAYFENITLHAADQALILGHKTNDTAVTDLIVDYVAWARART